MNYGHLLENRRFLIEFTSYTYKQVMQWSLQFRITRFLRDVCWFHTFTFQNVYLSVKVAKNIKWGVKMQFNYYKQLFEITIHANQ